MTRGDVSAWQLDAEVGDTSAAPRAAPSSSARRVFFPDGDTVESVGAESAARADSSTRRKKVGWGSELVIDDATDGQDAQADAANRRSRSSKVDETAAADVVASVGCVAASDGAGGSVDALAHHLVRSYLLLHGQEDVAALLDLEKPCPALSASALERLQQQVMRSASAPLGAPESALERFLRGEWSYAASRSRPSRRHSKEHAGKTDKSREGGKSKASSSSRRNKPVLNVVTSGERAMESIGAGEEEELDFNRLNRPGSTPRAAGSPMDLVLGKPGSTPMARAKDLAALGFDDLDEALATDQQPAAAPTPSEKDGSESSELSQYALAKREAKRHSKRVQLGEPGSTPTKEYVFFRETPPRFVTESVEAAADALAALGDDPTFRAPTLDKFVELQSGDVGKYRVGQRVEGLGAARNVSGVVCKLFGSRQCGSSGPGAIVVDTSPDDAADAAPCE